MTLLPLLWLACAPDPLTVSATDAGGTVLVEASRAGFAVVVQDAEGLPVVRGSASISARSATLALPPGVRGIVEVVVTEGGERAGVRLDLGDADALDATLAVPLGAVPIPLSPGDTVPLVLVEGTTAQAALRVRAPRGDAVTVSLDGAALAEVGAGEARLLSFPVTDDATLTLSTAGGVRLGAAVDVQSIPLAAARERIRVVATRFPTLPDGQDDDVRPTGRVTLPSAWWRRLLDHTALGVRARDPHAPWAWTAVDLRNDGDRPFDVVVRLRVLGPDRTPDRAFRPRMRDADDGTGNISVLMRLPPGRTVTASLPLFVDDAAVGVGPWTRVVEVLPLGLGQPLRVDETPLYVSRSSSLLAAGLVATLAVAAAGGVWVVTGVRRWLRELDTASLVTIALFSALSFVAGAVGQLVGLGLAAAVGPFATMVTGLLDDALQATLLGTLVTLLPRPGVATLSVLVAWLLRGVATGTLSPQDLLFVGCRIATLEASLWAFGLTRGVAWRDGARWMRLVRLGGGLAAAALLGTATALVLHSALYRLYYAPWYVGMVLAGPGFLYVLAAAGVAERVATQLRRVED
ncbi:MAG: hypothetical protein EXR71_14450 [Myxococcales bacterium]|nr:hypothetical protein [Myxococcales bacterium]